MKKKIRMFIYALALLFLLWKGIDTKMNEMAPLPFEGNQDTERIV